LLINLSFSFVNTCDYIFLYAGMTLAFSTQSLDSHSVSVISSEAVRIAQSTPDLIHGSFTEIDDEEIKLIKRKSFGKLHNTAGTLILVHLTCQDTSTRRDSEGTFSVFFESSCHLLLPV